MCCIAKKLMFGVCAELRVLFGTADVLHVENLLYLALELKYLFCLALSMCWIAMHLCLALVLKCVFCLALSMCDAVPHLYILLLTFVLCIVLSAVRCVRSSSLCFLHARTAILPLLFDGGDNEPYCTYLQNHPNIQDAHVWNWVIKVTYTNSWYNIKNTDDFPTKHWFQLNIDINWKEMGLKFLADLHAE